MSSRAAARIRVAICLLGFQGGAAGATLLSSPLAAPPNGVSIERTAAFHNCLECADCLTLLVLKSAVTSIRWSRVTAGDLEAYPRRDDIDRYIDCVRMGVLEYIRQRFLGDPLQVAGGRWPGSEPGGAARPGPTIR
jgi:hypothetical protein